MSFDERLSGYKESCEAKLVSDADAYFQDGSQVSKAARYALLNGGKRVRGVLALAVCQALGGKLENALNFAAAIEMIHAFSLVHDDLPCMDDDDLRRGKPATHIAFGEATALLAGDMLAIQAFEVAAGTPAGYEWACKGVGVLAKNSGAKGMIYGQELDLYYEDKATDEDILNKVHLHKTGALIRASVQLGILAAGRNTEDEPVLGRYAEAIGLVFQIVDDILDATATEEQLGKPIGSDKEQGKNTYYTLLGAGAAKAKARKLTDDAVAELRQTYGNKTDFLCEYANTLCARVN